MHREVVHTWRILKSIVSSAPLLSAARHPEQAIQLCFGDAGEKKGPLEMVSELWPSDKN